MIPKLLRILLLIGMLIPYPWICAHNREVLNEWTLIGLGCINFACVVIFLVWDDIFYSNQINRRRDDRTE